MMSPCPCCVCLIGQPLWAVLAPWLRVLQHCAPQRTLCLSSRQYRAAVLELHHAEVKRFSHVGNRVKSASPCLRGHERSSQAVHTLFIQHGGPFTRKTPARGFLDTAPQQRVKACPMYSAYRGFTGELAGSFRSILNNSSRFQYVFCRKIPLTQSRALGHAGVALTTP